MVPLSCLTEAKHNHLRGSESYVSRSITRVCMYQRRNSPNPSLMFLKQMLQDFAILGVRCFCFISFQAECSLLEKRFCQKRCCIDLICRCLFLWCSWCNLVLQGFRKSLLQFFLLKYLHLLFGDSKERKRNFLLYKCLSFECWWQ